MTLPVYFEAQLMGAVHEDSDGPRFVYEQSWIDSAHAFPISITMPRALASRALSEVGKARLAVEAMPAGSHPFLPQVADDIAQRCLAILNGLNR